MQTQPPEEHSVQNSSRPPPTLPALLTLVPWEAWNPSSFGGAKRPRDITSTAMAMNCEVTRSCLSGGAGAGASGQAGVGGRPRTQRKLFQAHLF